MKRIQILIISVALFSSLDEIFSFPTSSDRDDNSSDAYFYRQKKQAPDFGPNAIVTQANCDVTESGAERTVYECFDGAQRPQGESLENLINSGRFDVIRGDCETTENGVSEENGRSVHKIVYMCYENQNQGSIQSSQTIQSDQVASNPYGPKRLSKRKRGPTYLPKIRSKRSTHIFYYALDKKPVNGKKRKAAV